MHRRLITLATVALLTAAPALSACSVDDVIGVFGPRADAEVLSLAQRADTDAAALAETAPETAELRRRHANQLYAEIDRLCGVRDDGRVPDSCAVERTTPEVGSTDPGEVLDRSHELILEEMTGLPDGSVALVTGQAIDLAALADPVELPEAFELTDREDVAAAQELLAWEHAASYGLGLASAYLSADQVDALAELADAHDERVLGLRALLEPSGQAPVAAPGYELEAFPAPTDPASAAEFITSLEADTVQLWHAAAADAHTAQWREWSVAGAAHAQDAAGGHNFTA
ncbi:hypothetical protein A605_08650 [Corynebacterium halotolerans YIM 70093 = DSM 44683]|uniref:DUF4439 domain-containing protein n=1 Tax=Corynebacterium halotolerans YIM 70093 = DSM 44683 TaxID=1121362 RepID=M1NTC8_9CORY|nr:hypothetical protein A605_08650 [Corynebacterium halotolerans YIM 70093 = DSM 44683]